MKGRSIGRRGLLAAVLTAVLFVSARVGRAQITNDQVPRDRTVPVKEQIESQMQSARWRLGPVRLIPEIRISGPTYDNNVFGASGDEPKISDWYVIFGAGLGFVLPVGRSVYLRGEAVPQYIWYDKLADRRQWGGDFGGAVDVFLGRAAFEGSYTKTLTPQDPNTAELIQVLGDTDRASGKIEVPLAGALSLFGSAVYQTIDYRPLGEDVPDELNPFADLNRREGAVRGGVRYNINSSFDVGVGAEGTRTEFVDDPQGGDNETTAYLASVYYNRPRLFVNFNGGYRIGKPINASTFPEFSTFTGSGYLSYELLRRLEIDLYGSRGINYGQYFENNYYFGSLGGIAAVVRIGYRLSVRVFGEIGEDVYPIAVQDPALGLVKRVDDVTTYGGGIQLLLFRSLSVTATASNTEFDSNLPEFDRSVFRFTTGFVLGVSIP